jgi:hypothetical protein
MEWLLTTIKPFLILLRSLNRQLRTIPVVDDFEERIRARYFSAVIVRRIIQPTDPDLHAALGLYEKRLDGELRFGTSDIIRWIEDDLKNRKNSSSAPRDYFLVAKHNHKIKAFVLFHYFPLKKMAFLAYMVVDRNTAGLALDELSQALASRILRLLSRDSLLRNCEALIFEVEDPRSAPQAKQLHNIARIQRFCSLAATCGFTLRAFDIAYSQPAFVVPSALGESEQALLLISARARRENDKANVRNEVESILDLIYFDLYPSGFSDIAEEQNAYTQYCRELRDRVINTLPEKIMIINPAHLTCGRRVRKVSRQPKAQA